MIRIEKALRKFWIDDEDIRDKIDGRIFARRVPDHTTNPCVVLTTITTSREYSLANEINVLTAVVQVDVYGANTAEVDEITELIRNRTSGYKGLAGDLFLQGCFILREQSEAKRRRDGSNRFANRNSTDYQIFFSQAIPTHA